MLYAYEITKVNEKYVGYVPDLEFKTDLAGANM